MTSKSLKSGFLGLLLALSWVFSASAKTDVVKKGGDPRITQIEQLVAKGRLKAAEEKWRKLRGRVPEQVWYYNLGVILTRAGKWPEAAGAFEQALQVREPEATIWKALKQVRTAQLEKAYSKVFASQPAVLPKVEWMQVKRQDQHAKKSEGPHAVLQAMEGWRKAWSAKNINAYLKYYADDFRPVSGLSHRAWVAQRKVRLSRPKFIQVKLSNIHVRQLKSDLIEVVFDQTYRSNILQDKVRKRLRWRKTRDGWKIVQEVVLR